MQDAIKRQDREAIRCVDGGPRYWGGRGRKKAQGGAGAARKCFTGSGAGRRRQEAEELQRRQAAEREAQLRAAEQAAREGGAARSSEQREAALRAREAEAARSNKRRAARRRRSRSRGALADDEAALQTRANAPSQPFATVSTSRAPQKLPSTKNEKGSAYDPTPSARKLNAASTRFLRAKNIDSRACAKMSRPQSF